MLGRRRRPGAALGRRPAAGQAHTLRSAKGDAKPKPHSSHQLLRSHFERGLQGSHIEQACCGRPGAQINVIGASGCAQRNSCAQRTLQVLSCETSRVPPRRGEEGVDSFRTPLRFAQCGVRALFHMMCSPFAQSVVGAITQTHLTVHSRQVACMAVRGPRGEGQCDHQTMHEESRISYVQLEADVLGLNYWVGRR